MKKFTVMMIILLTFTSCWVIRSYKLSEKEVQSFLLAEHRALSNHVSHLESDNNYAYRRQMAKIARKSGFRTFRHYEKVKISIWKAYIIPKGLEVMEVIGELDLDKQAIAEAIISDGDTPDFVKKEMAKKTKLTEKEKQELAEQRSNFIVDAMEFMNSSRNQELVAKYREQLSAVMEDKLDWE